MLFSEKLFHCCNVLYKNVGLAYFITFFRQISYEWFLIKSSNFVLQYQCRLTVRLPGNECSSAGAPNPGEDHDGAVQLDQPGGPGLHLHHALQYVDI